MHAFKRVLYYQTDKFLFDSVFGCAAVFHNDGVFRTFVGFGVSKKFFFDMFSLSESRALSSIRFDIVQYHTRCVEEKNYFVVSV